MRVSEWPPDTGDADPSGSPCWKSEGLPSSSRFAAADAPLRARAVCESMNLEIAPNSVNNVRLKLKRLVERGILTEPEQGLLTQPRP